MLFRRTPVSKALFAICGLSTLWGFYLHPPSDATRDSVLLYCSSGDGLLHWRQLYESGKLGKKELYIVRAMGWYVRICVPVMGLGLGSYNDD